MQAVLFMHRTHDDDIESNRVAGLTLLERQRRTFQHYGVTEMFVTLPAGTNRTLPVVVDPASEDIPVHAVMVEPTDDSTVLEQLLPRINGRVLFLRDDVVMDCRVAEALSACTSPTMVIDKDENSNPWIGGALLTRSFIAGISTRGMQIADIWEHLAEQSIAKLIVGDMPVHDVKMRTTTRPWIMRVRDTRDIRHTSNLIIKSTQKGAQDLIAKYIHPFFENLLTRLLWNTPIKPNHVTVVNALVGGAALGFFLYGWLGTGVACAIVVGILDGVDGKLARATMRFSNFGALLDRICDKVYEIGWFIAIGLALTKQTGTETPIYLSVLLIATYLLDMTVRSMFKSVMHHELYDYSTFDIRFNLVGGRRNIYVYMLLVGLVVHQPLEAWWAVATWSVVTFVVHSVLVTYHMSKARRSEQSVTTDRSTVS